MPSLPRYILLLTLAFLSACASGPADVGPQRTGGFRLEVYVQREGDSHSRYLLTEDGQLHFGGGFDALERKYTWSGAMSDEEIEQLRRILIAHDWLSQFPPHTGEAPPRYEIELDRASVQRSLEVEGHSHVVESLIEVLDTAARRRHEEVLRSLPQPSGAPPADGG